MRLNILYLKHSKSKKYAFRAVLQQSLCYLLRLRLSDRIVLCWSGRVRIWFHHEEKFPETREENTHKLVPLLRTDMGVMYLNFCVHFSKLCPLYLLENEVFSLFGSTKMWWNVDAIHQWFLSDWLGPNAKFAVISNH